MKITNFVHTTSESSAKELLLRGYTLISNNGNFWTFLNKDSNSMMFNDLERVIISNRLMF